MPSEPLFEQASGIVVPLAARAFHFDEAAKARNITIDFKACSRFAVAGRDGVHPVQARVVTTCRHQYVFQHRCHSQVRTPRVKLPAGTVVPVEPEVAGKLTGFTLLFHALILMLARHMPFAAVAGMARESAHRVTAGCTRYVELAVAQGGLTRMFHQGRGICADARASQVARGAQPMPVGSGERLSDVAARAPRQPA